MVKNLNILCIIGNVLHFFGFPPPEFYREIIIYKLRKGI